MRYWLVEVEPADAAQPQNEVDELAWLTAQEARDRLTYARDLDVLRDALEKLRLGRDGRVFEQRQREPFAQSRARDDERHAEQALRRGEQQRSGRERRRPRRRDRRTSSPAGASAVR